MISAVLVALLADVLMDCLVELEDVFFAVGLVVEEGGGDFFDMLEHVVMTILSVIGFFLIVMEIARKMFDIFFDFFSI